MLLPDLLFATDKAVKIDVPAEWFVGRPGTVTVTFDNTSTTGGGPLDSPNSFVEAIMPSAFTNFVAVPSQGTCTVSGREVTCELGTVEAGETATVTITATPTLAGTHTGVFTAGGDLFDPDPSNDKKTVVFTVEDIFLFLTAANFPFAAFIGEPVSAYTGELFFLEQPDLALAGPLPLYFLRYYGSLLAHDGRATTAFGPGWTHNFDYRLRLLDAVTADVLLFPGRILAYAKEGGAWVQTSGLETPFQLADAADGFVLANPRTGARHHFDASGTYTRLEDGRGSALTLAYDGDRLAEVADGLGAALVFSYDAEDRVTAVTQGSRAVAFAYTDGFLTGATNPLGETVTYSYDSRPDHPALLTARTRPAGNTPNTQAYDDEGRVVVQTDALGHAATITYDDGETRYTDPLGHSVAYVHTETGQITTFRDAGGASVEMTYDENGLRTSVADRMGGSAQLDYDDASGLVTAATGPDGQTTTYTLTPRTTDGLTFFDRTEVTLPDGTTAAAAYDDRGNQTSLTDAAGGTWSFSHNDLGQLLTATNPSGGTTHYTYHADATLASVTDPSGNTTSFTYDAFRRPVQVTLPDGTARSFTYDAVGRLLSRTDERGGTHSYTYDANGNVTTWTDAAGATTHYAYDAMDRLAAVTDRTGATASLTYDAAGRLEAVTDANGHTTRRSYDAHGHLVAITDAGGGVWSITYDAEGVPTTTTDPLGRRVALATDARGLVVGATDPLAHTTSYQRDALGRLMAATDPMGHTTTLGRDARGFLTDVLLPGGAGAAYARDALGLLAGAVDPAGGSWSYTHDAQGRLSGSTDPLGRSRAFTYDARGRLVGIDLPGSFGPVALTYDAAGALTAATFSDATTLTFDYDGLGRLVAAGGVTLARDAEGRLTATNGLALTRDDAGRLTGVALPAGDVAYAYDARGLLTLVRDWLGGETTFTYDAAGRLLTLTRPNGVTTSYSYDGAGRLLEITEAAGGATLAASTLERDARGDVVRATRTTPAPPPQEPGPTEAFGVDAAHQIEAFSYDALGRVTADAARQYTWDDAGRLTGLTAGGEATTYTYDAFGQRLTRTAGGTTTTYVWNYALGLPSVSVERADGADVRYYVHTPGGALLYRVDAAGGARTYYHYDETGNTLLLTDEAGAVAAAYTYGPYGALMAETGGVENAITFGGRYGVMREGDTGLYYMRARYYDSAAGRFLSPDPIRTMDPRTLNPYQYALGNPGRYIDPRGTRSYEAEVREAIDRMNAGRARRDLEWSEEMQRRYGGPAETPPSVAPAPAAAEERYGEPSAVMNGIDLTDLPEEASFIVFFTDLFGKANALWGGSYEHSLERLVPVSLMLQTEMTAEPVETFLDDIEDEATLGVLVAVGGEPQRASDTDGLPAEAYRLASPLEQQSFKLEPYYRDSYEKWYYLVYWPSILNGMLDNLPSDEPKRPIFGRYGFPQF